MLRPLTDLRRRLLRTPRLWLVLLLWPIVALLLILAPSGILQAENPVHGAALTAVAITAVASLILFTLVARRVLAGILEVRKKLFDGDFEGALDAARHNPAVGQALGFQNALARMLEFDARRADKVAAATRLFSSFLQESGLPFFIADVEEDLLHLSRAARQLFGVNVERFSLLSVLLLPSNREFAALYASVAGGDRARADARLTLHLPVRQAAKTVQVRLIPIQNDEGLILFVIGFLTPAPAAAAPASVTDLSPTTFFQSDRPSTLGSKGNDDAASHD